MVEHIPIAKQEDFGPYYRVRSFTVVAASDRDVWITATGMGGNVVSRHAVSGSQAGAWKLLEEDLSSQIEHLQEQLAYAGQKRREET